MRLPENYKLDFKTPSGKIELYNPHDVEAPNPLFTALWVMMHRSGSLLAMIFVFLDSSFCELEFDDPELMKLRDQPLKTQRV